MSLNRRNFIITALSAILTPKNIFSDNKIILYGDGIHDDSDALQQWIDGYKIYNPDGTVLSKKLRNKKFLISSPIILRNSPDISHCYFNGYGKSILITKLK